MVEFVEPPDDPASRTSDELVEKIPVDSVIYPNGSWKLDVVYLDLKRIFSPACFVYKDQSDAVLVIEPSNRTLQFIL